MDITYKTQYKMLQEAKLWKMKNKEYSDNCISITDNIKDKKRKGKRNKR